MPLSDDWEVEVLARKQLLPPYHKIYRSPRPFTDLRNSTSGTTASRAVTVTLTDVNGTLISTWNVSANTSASYLSPTVSVVIPLLQGSNTLANIRRSLASRDPLTVRMSVPRLGC